MKIEGALVNYKNGECIPKVTQAIIAAVEKHYPGNNVIEIFFAEMVKNSFDDDYQIDFDIKVDTGINNSHLLLGIVYLNTAMRNPENERAVYLHIKKQSE